MGVHAQLVHPASFKNSFKDLEMFCPGFLFYHNIIYIVFQLLMHHVMEDGCHGTLASAFFKAKRHHSVIEVPNQGPKCCFLDVLGNHPNLSVSTIPIHEGEHGTSCS